MNEYNRHSGESRSPVNTESPPATRYYTGCRVKPGMTVRSVRHPGLRRNDDRGA